MKAKQKQLYDLCRKFVEDNKISCPEAVHQTDRVIENAYELIEGICEIVGYYEDPADQMQRERDELSGIHVTFSAH